MQRSLTKLSASDARRLTLLAIWLFVAAWALPIAHVATLWNNVLCSIALFVVSLVPSDTTTLPGGLGRLARLT